MVKSLVQKEGKIILIFFNNLAHCSIGSHYPMQTAQFRVIPCNSCFSFNDSIYLKSVGCSTFLTVSKILITTLIQLHRRFLQREVPMVPNLCYPACDVRDVAGAHITAMTSPTAPGKHKIFNPRLLVKNNNKRSVFFFFFF